MVVSLLVVLHLCWLCIAVCVCAALSRDGDVHVAVSSSLACWLLCLSQHGATALHFASRDGHLGAAELLLGKGAAVDSRDDVSVSLLLMCVVLRVSLCGVV